MTIHRLDIEINAEGSKLAYLHPTNDQGEIESGYRIAGPKAWGGSRNIARLKISDDDLITYIKEYAPNVLEKIQGKNK